MRFRILCPYCQTAFQVKDPATGAVFTCPRCRAAVRVGRAQAPVATLPGVRGNVPPRGKPAPPPLAPAAEEEPLPLGPPKTLPPPRPGRLGPILGVAGAAVLLLGGFVTSLVILGLPESPRRHAAAPSAAAPTVPAPATPAVPAAPPVKPAPTAPARPAPAPPAPPPRPEPPNPPAPPPAGPQKRTLDLPAQVTSILPARGGRYLLLHLPAQRQVAVFDLFQGQVVHSLPLAEDNVVLAAGAEHLLVFLVPRGQVQRWSLTTFQRDLTVPVPCRGPVRAAALGAAARGPALLVADEPDQDFPVYALDPETLVRVPLELPKEPRIAPYHPSDPVIRAAANGQAFALWDQGPGQATNLLLLAVHGNTLQAHRPPIPFGFAVPAPDGRTVHTANGPHNLEGHRVGGWEQTLVGPLTVPALSGWTFLNLGSPARAGTPNRQVDRVEVHWPGAGPPLAVLTDVDGLDLPWPQDLFRTRLPLDQRVWFCPAGNVLVTLPSTGQRLHLYPFNLEAALARNPGHAPLVTSTPPAHFVRGQGLVYAVEVRSARGGLTYRLEVGPPGMTVGPTGILTWDVPADFPEVVASVILAIRDGAGQEVFQTFKLTPAPTVAARPGWPNLPAPGLPGAGDPAEVAAAPAAEVPLPSPAEYVCAGAGGRYLLCQLPQQRLLAVFDVARAEIVKYLPLAADKALVAAGRSHLLVVYPQEHQVQRWSLATFEREATQPLPLGKVKVTGVTMGAASDGPLVVTGPEVFTAEHPFRLIDPRTLREQTVDVAPSRGAGRSRLEAVPQVGLSADGQVLCSRVAVGGWQTLTLGRTPRTGVLTNALENVLPGPDGKTLYTSHGPFTLQGVPLEGADLRAGPFTLPAVQGPFYLTVNAGVSRYPTAYPVGPRATHPPGVAIHAQGDARPLVRLYHLLGLDNLAMTGSPLTVDRRIFLLPAANLLVTVPHAADRLYLYRCDVTDLLEKAGRDFLLVVSQPPTTAARGGTFRYPIAARSRHGGIQYKLEAGPKGMTVGPDGVVTWAVPEDWAEAEVHVLLSLKAGSGMQTFHSFKITIAVTGPARRREP